MELTRVSGHLDFLFSDELVFCFWGREEKLTRKSLLTLCRVNSPQVGTVLALAVVLLECCTTVRGFYVPGVAPVEFRKGQKIDVKAVKMTSTHTQLPYEYYSLQFCLPKNGTLVYKSENLGEVLRGDRIVNTPYEVRMAENVRCKLLCNSKDRPLNWDREQSEKVAERIRHEYFVHLYALGLGLFR